MLKLYNGIVAVLSCIPLDCTPIVFDVIQFAVEIRVEDGFVSAFAYLDLKLRCSWRKSDWLSRILIA